ncbi:MAG: class I SAM-dependent methyltransferase [Chloroflexi bacterium]|nr:class I SAM-dependent methyltransferase [Chloroflexota bacterium]
MSERRKSYDPIAQIYDRARPSYPAALFDDIVAYANLDDEARLLEIGSGTGQATLPLAQRGCAIDCIELGAELAVVARWNLAAYPKVKVINADFETVALSPPAYDLVYAATAFHWIDPAISFSKAHDLLKPGGALALFWHRPALTDASRAYVFALQDIYRRVAPKMAEAYDVPPGPDEVSTEYAELIPNSGLFEQLAIRKHYVLTEYSAGAYVELLSTFSDHIALPPKTRRQLFKEIGALIKREFAGVVPRETVALLYLARRK